jgi:NAD(P)-dependent dehydrogenase (short-subunit alcohol dehydrogenase family)
MSEPTNSPTPTAGWNPGLGGAGAVVFGVGPGIGLACVQALAGLGADVACVDIDPDRAAAAVEEVKECPGTATAFTCDLRRAEQVKRVVAEITEALGSIEAAVSVVGHGGPAGPVVTMPDEVWRDVLQINLDQQFLVTREVLRPMSAQGHGSIVLISSINALGSSPQRAAYGAAKAGLVSLARSLAIEAAPRGVRVNTVAPGATRTPRRRHLAEGELAGVYRAAIPLGRIAEPQDVAHAAVFLASDLAAFITGQTLVVDGGATVKYSQPAGN